MACIGCNDCMLACPLPQTLRVSIAELNYAVQQPAITNPNVIDFVTACTQCRQCVPVCPADLSRADMVLFNKLKVEDSISDRLLTLQVGQAVQPATWTLDGLATHLSGMPLFANVNLGDLRRTILKATLRQLGRGHELCREGTYHERFFVIIEGAVEQTITGSVPGVNTRILVLGPGSFHGEMAVMANLQEQFTVIALQQSLVLEIPKTTLYQLMAFSQVFRERMETLYERRAIWTHVRRSPVLAPLPDEALQQLLEEARLEILQPGGILCREGEPVRDMLIVRSGFLRVSRRFGSYGDRVLLYFRDGDTFGALSVLTENQESSFTVEANTRAELIRIPGAVIKKVLDRFPRERQRILAQAEEAERVARSPSLGPPANALAEKRRENTTQMGLSWSALLDKGVMQGHELLVIDQKICTNCNNCVDACGRRHGNTRLERSGLQLDNLLFPTACRHCEDPVCLLCSVNGIVRLPDGEITIITDNCIGCGACADRCPYHNIKMHPAETRKPNLLAQLTNLIRLNPEPAAPTAENHAARLAVKCDLCAGYSDYACVTACPVGAAFRVDPVKTFGRNDMLIGLEMRKRE